MLVTVCSFLSLESPARSAMGSAVLCQWSLCRGQDWTGVLPTPLPLPLLQLQLPLRGQSPCPTLLEWGMAWTQRRCRAAAAAARGRPTQWAILHPLSTSIPTGQSARPISCSICSRWWWRPCGSISLPGPFMHQWMQSNLTCLWVLTFCLCVHNASYHIQTATRFSASTHSNCTSVFLILSLWWFKFIAVCKLTITNLFFTVCVHTVLFEISGLLFLLSE